MCAPGSKFEAKSDNLVSDIEGVKTYINGILFLIKDIFPTQIYCLRGVFVGKQIPPKEIPLGAGKPLK